MPGSHRSWSNTYNTKEKRKNKAKANDEVCQIILSLEECL